MCSHSSKKCNGFVEAGRAHLSQMSKPKVLGLSAKLWTCNPHVYSCCSKWFLPSLESRTLTKLNSVSFLWVQWVTFMWSDLWPFKFMMNTHSWCRTMLRYLFCSVCGTCTVHDVYTVVTVKVTNCMYSIQYCIYCMLYGTLLGDMQHHAFINSKISVKEVQ